MSPSPRPTKPHPTVLSFDEVVTGDKLVHVSFDDKGALRDPQEDPQYVLVIAKDSKKYELLLERSDTQEQVVSKASDLGIPGSKNGPWQRHGVLRLASAKIIAKSQLQQSRIDRGGFNINRVEANMLFVGA